METVLLTDLSNSLNLTWLTVAFSLQSSLEADQSKHGIEEGCHYCARATQQSDGLAVVELGGLCNELGIDAMRGTRAESVIETTALKD